MAYTMEQYTALQAAIAEGALTVRYADKSVQYQKLDDMVRILKMMATELGLNAGNDGGRRYASFSKGY